ncbi:MAG: helix-turn-helix domain-containing protein [Methylococcales bacterium]|nr:helix-turn-helix domain-containing protein [Methylococcales bacterium]
MNIQPIKTEQDYENSLHKIEQLWGSPDDSKAGDELDILLILVEAYDAKYYPVALPDPINAIKFRMEQLGLTRKDLEPFLGSRGRVSEIFSKKRNLSLTMIRALHKNLQIPLESLIH